MRVRSECGIMIAGPVDQGQKEFERVLDIVEAVQLGI